MIEAVLHRLASFFQRLGTFFYTHANALEERRMRAKYVGRHVRVTCGQDHYGRVLTGVWFVTKFDDEARDLKLVQPAVCDMPGHETVTWAKPECVEVVSP